MLRIDPSDSLAAQTRVQLLISLDRYTDALNALSADADALTRAYCYYKTAREPEASALLQALPDEANERAVKVLEAQVVRTHALSLRCSPMH